MSPSIPRSLLSHVLAVCPRREVVSADIPLAEDADGPADAVRPVDDADVLLDVSGAEVAVEGSVQPAVQHPAVVTEHVLTPVQPRTGPAGVAEPGRRTGPREGVLKEITHLSHFFENVVNNFHNTVFHSFFRNTNYFPD